MLEIHLSGGCEIFTSHFNILCYELPYFDFNVSGDDNLCNTPHLPPCSPPKQGKKENGPPRSHVPKGRRLVFDNQLTIKSPSKREQARGRQNKIHSSVQKGQDITTNSEQRCPLEKESACVRLFKQEGSFLHGSC